MNSFCVRSLRRRNRLAHLRGRLLHRSDGRTGVEWTPTRGTRQRSLGERIHVVSPFSRIYSVDLREQEMLGVLADNGLDIKMTSSILFQPIDTEVYQLIKETGPEYYGTLIAPYVRSSARRVVGRYSPEEIYSTKREQIEREIRDEVVRKLDGRHLRINAILIREVHLPPQWHKFNHVNLARKPLLYRHPLGATVENLETSFFKASLEVSLKVS